MSAWKPGDVAIVNVPKSTLPGFAVTESGREDVAVAFSEDGWTLLANLQYFWGSDYSFFAGKPRPLVVIDPEDREQVDRLYDAFNDEYVSREADNLRDGMQAALRSLIAPPKPEEPTGLGAVVEDADGLLWVLSNPASSGSWMPESAPSAVAGNSYWKSYHDITAVRVLSEGVQP